MKEMPATTTNMAQKTNIQNSKALLTSFVPGTIPKMTLRLNAFCEKVRYRHN
jgi:hypothetical protein